MKSMTGYGRGECTMYERKFTVEIKAVNHRYNDITVKLPRAIMGFEDEIKKAISKKVFRGKLDVFVNFESFSQEDINISVNEPLAKSYTETLRKLKSDLHLDGDVTIEDNVWRGQNVTILQGVKIGEGAIIQAGSVVVSDIEPCGIAGGHPAKVFKKRNEEHYYQLKQEKKFF